MRPVQNTNPFKSVGDVIIDESMRHGPIMTLLVTAAISIGAAGIVAPIERIALHVLRQAA